MHGVRRQQRQERRPSRARAGRTRDWCLFVLSSLICSWPHGAWGEERIHPEARSGWEIQLGERLEMAPLPLERAPLLPAWVPHGSPAEDAAAPEPEDGRNSEEIMLGALRQGVEQANRYLPAPVSGRFTLWIFDRVPYAARMADSHTIVVAGRVVRGLRYRERLPCVLAHELHHLALARAGLYQNSGTFELALLRGLMAEGIATWMCATSSHFPEIGARLSDRQALGTAFDRVRDLMRAPPEARPDANSAFREHKFGYDVGAWMVSRIEECFGREAWLELLRNPAADAPRRFVELYLATHPPAEYRF